MRRAHLPQGGAADVWQGVPAAISVAEVRLCAIAGFGWVAGLALTPGVEALPPGVETAVDVLIEWVLNGCLAASSPLVCAYDEDITAIKAVNADATSPAGASTLSAFLLRKPIIQFSLLKSLSGVFKSRPFQCDRAGRSVISVHHR